jgi:hypothetical protein
MSIIDIEKRKGFAAACKGSVVIGGVIFVGEELKKTHSYRKLNDAGDFFFIEINSRNNESTQKCSKKDLIAVVNSLKKIIDKSDDKTVSFDLTRKHNFRLTESKLRMIFRFLKNNDVLKRKPYFDESDKPKSGYRIKEYVATVDILEKTNLAWDSLPYKKM